MCVLLSGSLPFLHAAAKRVSPVPEAEWVPTLPTVPRTQLLYNLLELGVRATEIRKAAQQGLEQVPAPQGSQCLKPGSPLGEEGRGSREQVEHFLPMALAQLSCTEPGSCLGHCGVVVAIQWPSVLQ